MRLALLIDAENLTPALAPALLKMAGERGALPIRRAYGHAERAKGWLDIAGVNFHHVPSAKNSADMAICIAAMDLLNQRLADGIVLASSDSDFTLLAVHLRETGFSVYGYGDERAPLTLRTACATFDVLPQKTVPSLANSKAIEQRSLSEQLSAVIQARNGSVALHQINTEIRHQLPDFKISTHPKYKTWRDYFKAHSAQFVIVGDGPEACVKLAS